MSPLVVHTGEIHAELLSMVPGLQTSRHAHHYRGFANSQWALFNRTNEIKPLLYTFRALLTGITLMRTGVVDATLPNLGGPAYLAELIEAKRTGEHRNLDTTEVVEARRLAADVERLHEELAAAQATTSLPERPTVDEQMHDLVVRARLG